MGTTYILNRSLPVTNEIVHRKKDSDDRREIDNKKSANDIIYLGTESNFRKNVANYISGTIIDDLYSRFDTKNKNEEKGSRAMQLGTGILVKHSIDLEFLKIHIPFIDSYFKEFRNRYKFPNFDIEYVSNKMEDYLKTSKHFIFYSDIVFIADKEPKPYFKWFRDDIKGQKNENFDFLKEFLIPKVGHWNFKINSFEKEELSVTWEMTYSDVVYSCLKSKKLSEETKEFLIEKALFKMFDIDNKEDIETVKRAIVKVRINQSKFRRDLLKSSKNSCVFTQVKKPDLLLIAGHILPWEKSTDIQRLDINNGILLTPTFDKLFDKFLISFDEEGIVKYSEKIKKSVWNKLFPTFKNIQDIKIDINELNKDYLEYHRNKFKENAK